MGLLKKVLVVATLAAFNFGASGIRPVLGGEAYPQWECDWCAGPPTPHVCCGWTCHETCNCPNGPQDCSS
jgi:hypothetical protein